MPETQKKYEKDNGAQRRFEEYFAIHRKDPVSDPVLKKYRETYGFQDETEQLYITACAPTVIYFVKWVLEQAHQKKLKRLYFLARDGYQFYMAAKYLCKVWKLDMDCRYLRVSRFAMRVPEYHLLGKGCLERICIGGIDVTFEKIMKRAALTDAEALQVAKQAGWQEKYKEILNYQQILELKKELMQVDCLFEYINAHSKTAYQNTMGYLTQEGLLEDVAYGLVDSGWIGTLQQSIQRLLRTAKTNVTLEGFYFGLYELPKDITQSRYHGYYFEPRKGLSRKVYFSNSLFEAIFSATEGMTLRYEKKNMRYVPITDSRQNQNWKRLAQNNEALEKYLEIYSEVERVFKRGAKRELRTVKGLLSLFMARPSALEIAAYGQQVFSDDVLEHDMRSVAAKLSDEDIKNQRLVRKLLVIFGLRKAVLRESAWIEASVVMNGVHINLYLRHVAFYKYFVYIRKMLKQLGT